MKPIDKFIQVLCTKAKGYAWFSGEKRGSLGNFVALTAHVDGFKIVLKHHNYAQARLVPHKVTRRRYSLPANAKTWIEISITDDFARFGRRAIVHQHLVFLDSEPYKELYALMEKLMPEAKFFEPHSENRLSTSQSIMALCEAL